METTITISLETLARDYILVDIVANLENDEIVVEDLLTLLRERIPGSFDIKKPGNPWLGKAVKRLGLVIEKLGGKHQGMVYRVNKEQANKLLGVNGTSADNSEK